MGVSITSGSWLGGHCSDLPSSGFAAHRRSAKKGCSLFALCCVAGGVSPVFEVGVCAPNVSFIQFARFPWGSVVCVWVKAGVGSVVSVCATWGCFGGFGGSVNDVDAVVRVFTGGESVFG